MTTTITQISKKVRIRVEPASLDKKFNVFVEELLDDNWEFYTGYNSAGNPDAFDMANKVSTALVKKRLKTG